MFVRKKRNKSGSVSVQIIDKSSGKYKVVKSLGSSKNKHEVEALYKRAIQMMPKLMNQPVLNFSYSNKDKEILDYMSNNEIIIRTVGPELVLGKIFDSMGFGAIKEELFRDMVITRLIYPGSKLRTLDYLIRHKGLDKSVQSIYRFLDRLNEKHKTTIEAIAYSHAKKLFKNISVVFYDMTTLYFEAEKEDDLRKIGYSKDGKFNKPQIMLGLLVGESGYPIGYDIFEGNTFEGNTLIPILRKMERKYGFNNPIVVADAALLSKTNLKRLNEQAYEFIIAGRIKNEDALVKEKILKLAKNIQNSKSFEIKKEDGSRLIVGYSSERAKKDAYNRQKGLRRLRAKLASGKLGKQHINNRGYNKFLNFDGSIKISINEAKIKADEQWDGLKGYITNTKLPASRVIKHYSQLWRIEAAFRISKTDLRIRPIHHYKRRRIESHILICFVAYSIWKELDRLLKETKLNISTAKALRLLETVYEMRFKLPDSGIEQRQLIKLSSEQRRLIEIISSLT